MYNHLEIENKWRDNWEKSKLFATPKLHAGDSKKYILFAFAYPSGSGLHVGHGKPYVAVDIMARFYRLNGNKVLVPTGWDAFGLPAENFAIKNGVHPRISTDKAIENYESQVKLLGMSSDWADEIATHNPDYYKWTQWFFQLLYKRGLAYKKEAVVNWDPVDQTVLANEQVLPDGTGERSGAKVEQRKMNQWFFKITDYIEDKTLPNGRVRKGLINGLENLDWPASTKQMQRNWIGKSVGINITYKIVESNSSITVYTTRPDTNFGATFIVVAPDCDWVKDNFGDFKYKDKCQEYIDKTKLKTELDRLSDGKLKTGEFTGLHAINPLNDLELPIYLSDFVISSVGTGAVVGVPGHDERDFDFAKAKHLPIIRVITGKNGADGEIDDKSMVQTEEGKMVNSDFLNGLSNLEAKEKIKDYIEEHNFGKRVINYRLRDWSVSRQRYWGCPIPIYYKPASPKYSKILLLTTNPGKIRHIKTLLADANVEISTLDGLDYQIAEPQEIGENVVEIAQNKAKYYWEKLQEKMPVLCTDHGMELFGVDPLDNPSKFVKKPVLEKYGQVNDDLIVKYYSELAAKYGGQVAQQYQFGLAIYDGKNLESTLEISDNVLVQQIQQPILPGYPLDSVLKTNIGNEEIYLNNLDKINKTSFYTNYQRGLYRLLGLDTTQNQEVLVPEADLPVILPEDVEFIPTGRSPLIDHKGFHKDAQNKYGVGVTREVDTMDNFVCSSWFFFRFVDSQNTQAFASPENLKLWLPVDEYIVGAEHTVLHLLYARFFTKVLFDEGLINFDEPFQKITHQGMVLGSDNRKMSKRWGNVVNPTDVINEFGADTLRLYEMFMGPFKDSIAWSSATVKGVKRFLDKTWNLQKSISNDNISTKIETGLHKLIQKITKDISSYSFNTAVSEYMKFVNLVTDEVKNGSTITADQFQRFLIVFYPFAPFIGEEMYSVLKLKDKKEFLQLENWPSFDPALVIDDVVTIAVQINGKVRASFEIEKDTDEKIVLQKALELGTKWLENKQLKFSKVIPNKLVTLAVN